MQPPESESEYEDPLERRQRDAQAQEARAQKAKRIRVGILLLILLGAGLAYLRIWLLENWTPDWDESQLVSVQILVPPNLDSDEQELLDELEAFTLASEGVASFTALDDWFLAEQQRYGVDRGGVSPVVLSVAAARPMESDPIAPPLGDEPFLERYQKTNEFLDFYAKHRTESPATNTIYLIFYRRSTHPEFAKIHSVADRRSRSGFVFASLDENGLETAVINISHELLHLFGANDKYENKSCKFPGGYAEPFRDPRHPQRFAEVMAQGIPNGPGQAETEVSSFGETRIGVQTATEIGWIDDAQRVRYYGGDLSAGPTLDEEE
ncbi:MAG: hypothetical protein JKY65_05895 [Planctomycetes bacterium]|nr:hypothetical protein [Planctomycetota bacterium]